MVCRWGFPAVTEKDYYSSSVLGGSDRRLGSRPRRRNHGFVRAIVVEHQVGLTVWSGEQVRRTNALLRESWPRRSR